MASTTGSGVVAIRAGYYSAGCRQVGLTKVPLREVLSGNGIDRADGDFEGALLFVQNVQRHFVDERGV